MDRVARSSARVAGAVHVPEDADRVGPRGRDRLPSRSIVVEHADAARLHDHVGEPRLRDDGAAGLDGSRHRTFTSA
jgi:hypothetical protein